MRTRRTPYTYKKEYWKDLPPFDSERDDYTDKDLELYANALLDKDRHDNPTGPRILMQEHIEPDWRKEVSPGWDTKDGRVDSSITAATSPDNQTMFNRFHPLGRPLNSNHQRKVNGASWFRS